MVSPPAFAETLPKGHFQNGFTVKDMKKLQNSFACTPEAKNYGFSSRLHFHHLLWS
jgi:hypothetical protein